jgi:hypothetical protein
MSRVVARTSAVLKAASKLSNRTAYPPEPVSRTTLAVTSKGSWPSVPTFVRQPPG